MSAPSILMNPSDRALLLVDQQAGLAFAVSLIDRQRLLNNVVALARTPSVFKIPVIATTSASEVHSGPLAPAIGSVLPGVTSVERRNMNSWENETVRAMIVATKRRNLLFSGLLTEACVSFPVMHWRGADKTQFRQFLAGLSEK